ncbi:MAG: c-type cytochrome biogenesis protein CcsB [Candidatus Krumholzibacteria bacterium]|nr:c-type cytochrome biogenesis protein CcsB [Candidatus Krumholzibacteria bacterium]
MASALDMRFFWYSFWMYLAAFVLFSIYAAVRRRRVGLTATVVFLAAFTFHTAGLAARWVITTHPPFSTMYEYAIAMSWAAALSFIIIMARFRRMALGVVVSPAIVLVLVIASLLPKTASMQLMPALQSYWFYIHVTLAACAEGAFVLAAGAGMVYLVRGKGKRGNEADVMPSRELLEEIISRSLRIGYPLFTIGALFAGAIWAQFAWGSFWSWDPKETGSLVLWLYYTLMLHQNMRGAWRGRTLAVMSIVGLAIAIVSFIGNLFFGGMHAYV